MTESIWIAIIGAVGVIGAAIIGLFKKSVFIHAQEENYYEKKKCKNNS